MQLMHSVKVCLHMLLFVPLPLLKISPSLCSINLYSSLFDFVGRKPGDMLFDKIDTTRLNAHLKDLMPGLTAKVFRTYNASVTLDDIVS
jgi:hypothetical protein